MFFVAEQAVVGLTSILTFIYVSKKTFRSDKLAAFSTWNSTSTWFVADNVVGSS